MTNATQKLAARGFVRTAPYLRDGRGKLIVPTESGWAGHAPRSMRRATAGMRCRTPALDRATPPREGRS